MWTETAECGLTLRGCRNEYMINLVNELSVLVGAVYYYYYYYYYYSLFGGRGGTVVKVLCYKSEGRWFDPS